MDTIPKEKIIKVVEIFFPKAKIFLFGSRARGTFTSTSDVDLAIDIGKPMSIEERAQLISMIDALNMPQTTDVVDFHRAPKELQANILKEGIIWKE